MMKVNKCAFKSNSFFFLIHRNFFIGGPKNYGNASKVKQRRLEKKETAPKVSKVKNGLLKSKKSVEKSRNTGSSE